MPLSLLPILVAAGVVAIYAGSYRLRFTDRTRFGVFVLVVGLLLFGLGFSGILAWHRDAVMAP